MKIDVKSTAAGFPRVEWEATVVNYQKPMVRQIDQLFDELFIEPDFTQEQAFNNPAWKRFYRVVYRCFMDIVIVNPNTPFLRCAFNRDSLMEGKEVWLPADHVSTFIINTSNQRYHLPADAAPDYFLILADIGSGELYEVANDWGHVRDIERLRGVLQRTFVTQRPKEGWTGVPLDPHTALSYNIVPRRPSSAYSAFDDDDPV